MKLLIDDANIAKIKKISEFFPVDGGTSSFVKVGIGHG